jgi:spermidine synthase
LTIAGPVVSFAPISAAGKEVQKLKPRVIFGMRASLGVAALMLAACVLLWLSPTLNAVEQLFDPEIRAAMMKRKDGQIAHIETVYNDIFVWKYRNVLTMNFHWKGYYSQESQVNLTDPDDLLALYARAVSIAAIYPQDVKRVLVLGLGGGSIPVYLGHFLPDAIIDTVEIDPGVIDVAKTYFGIRETSTARLIENDGRVFLNRNKQPYDLIVVDAFSGSYIPFHLMTKEFYRLVRDRLAPGGVAAFNIISGTKLYDSSLITFKNVFDRIDLYNPAGEWGVIVTTPRDPVEDGEALRRRAVAAQERYKFRFDVGKLAADWRIEMPKTLKGEALTDDFAPVNVYDAYGRRYRRK